MKGTLTIAAREVRERAFVLIAAAIVSFMPFITAALHSSGTSAGQVMTVVGTTGTTLLTLGLAIALGTSMVSRELSDRRMSFYFSKPVTPQAIWFGKLGGAIALMLMSAAITFLPAFAGSYREWNSTWNTPVARFAALLVASAIGFLLISHALATVTRSRSPIAAVDLVLTAVAGVIAWLLVRPLFLAGATKLTTWIVFSLVASIPILIIAAGAWQLERGRADLRRNHVEFSKFFWIAAAVVLAIVAAFLVWVFSAGPRDLEDVDWASNATGDWVAVTGHARYRGDYHPLFLVDTNTGHATHLGGQFHAWRGDFNHRGDAVIAAEPSVTRGPSEITIHRLTPQYSVEETGIEASPYAPTVISDDLTRLAIYDRDVLSVHDLTSKKLIASVRVPAKGWAQMFFVNDDLVRLYVTDMRGSSPKPLNRSMAIYEFNAKTRQLMQTRVFSTMANGLFMRVSADGSTLLIVERGGEGNRARVLDARSGEERGVINGSVPFWVTPLSGGGVAYVQNGATSVLRVFDGHVALVREIPLPRSGIGIIREVQPGKSVVVALRSAEGGADGGWNLYLVDLQSGSILRSQNNAKFRVNAFGDDPRWPGPSGEYVIADAQNALWRWSALTGTKTRVF